MKKTNYKLPLKLNKFKVASLNEIGRLYGGDDDPTTDDKNKSLIDNGGQQLCKSIKLNKKCDPFSSIFGESDELGE